MQILRGIAVLSVMLAHFGALLPAGFLGVDLFFGISGYVITLSFLRLASRNRNSLAILRQFWWARFWRLFPSLSLVLSFTILLAFLLLPPKEFLDQWQMTVWSFFFMGNFGVELVSRGDYFDPGATQNWLMHLWSLGVEEQFYLLFPALIGLTLFLKRKGVNPLHLIFGLLLISLFIASLDELEFFLKSETKLTEIAGLSAVLGYYSPITRAWQFLVGVGVAMFQIFQPRGLAIRRGKTLGMAIILVSLLITPESNLLPGPWTILPMLGVALVLLTNDIGVHDKHSFLKPIIWLGDRSYNAYLWHWPIWAGLTVFFDETIVLSVAALVLTLGISAVVHVLLEQPLIARSKAQENLHQPRSQARPTQKWIPGFALMLVPLLIGLIASSSLVALRESGAIRGRVPPDWVADEINCFEVDCLSKKIDVLLVGDSHAMALANSLRQELEEKGQNLYSLSLQGCLHLPNEEVVSAKDKCNELVNNYFDILEQNPPQQIIFFGYTTGRFTNYNSGAEVPIELVFSSSGDSVTEETSSRAFKFALEGAAKPALDKNIPVAIMSATPDFAFSPESVGARGKLASVAELIFSSNLGLGFGDTVSRDAYFEKNAPFIKIEEGFTLAHPLAIRLDPWDFICEKDFCRQVDENGVQLFSDRDHLSQSGAMRLSRGIVETLFF